MPPQSWEAETEFAHDLGQWGKTRLNFHYSGSPTSSTSSPSATDRQGIGNLPQRRSAGAESTSTIQFDPIGWKGAKLDVNAGFEWT